MKKLILPIATLLLGTANAQLVIDNATFFIGEGAVVTVQGNLQTNVAIQAGGAGVNQGKIQMKGASAQTITVNGANATIPYLEIDNTNNVSLLGTHDLTVQNRIQFTNGKLQLGEKNLIVPSTIAFDGTLGTGNSRFLETNGTGEVRQMVPAAVAVPVVVPIGTGTHYSPVQYTATGVTVNGSSYIGLRATGVPVPTPNRHPRTETYLGTAWNITRSGITGGTVNVQGTYTDGQIMGLGAPVESDIVGLFWNGASWSNAGSAQNAGSNTVAANVPANGLVYGMNKFVLVNPTVFLQGPFDATTGLMRDLLRSNDAVQTPGNPTASNIIPLSDPYRTATYSGNFPHVNNPNAESINASVLNHKANPAEHIVDWVFVQLRKSTGATSAPISQTRSALIRRDGRIVDIDGESPLYFKNEDPAANYVLTIRHRNHLSISVNPADPLALGLANSDFDFSNPANNAKIMGTSGTHYVQGGAPAKNLIWGGNASGNGFTRNIGSNGPGSPNQADRDHLLLDLGGAQLGVINNEYRRGDLNLNRVTRLVGNNGPSAAGIGDGNTLLNILGGNQLTVRSQVLPTN